MKKSKNGKMVTVCGLVVGLAVVGVVTVKYWIQGGKRSSSKHIEERTTIKKYNNKVGIVLDAWKEDGDPKAIIQYLKVDDVGKLGEDLINCYGFTKDSCISVVVEG